MTNELGSVTGSSLVFSYERLQRVWTSIQLETILKRPSQLIAIICELKEISWILLKFD